MQYFNRYPEGMNIGLALSGGADSSLLLYLLAKMVKDRSLSSDIICMHGIDTNMQIAVQPAEQIVEYVRNKFKDVNIILETFSYALDPKNENKDD